jgi:hypothetical protein
MQYATMVDLIEEAKLAGLRETQAVRDSLQSVFNTWLSDQELEGISFTEEEEEVLEKAFAEGFTNYYKA